MESSLVTDEMVDMAISWFARLRADDVTASDRENFFEWLREHRMHQHAFVEIVDLWEDMSVVRVLEFEELRPYPQLWQLRQEYKAIAGT